MTHMGIDPGGSGGICILHDSGRVDVTETHEHYCDLVLWVSNTLRGYSPLQSVRAVVEQVGGYIGKVDPGSSMFKFGQSYGSLLMMLECLRGLGGMKVEYTTVTPNVWQRALKIPPKRKGEDKESKGEYKARLASIARLTFPQRSINLSTADAMLIAEYARRVHKW